MLGCEKDLATRKIKKTTRGCQESPSISPTVLEVLASLSPSTRGIDALSRTTQSD